MRKKITLLLILSILYFVIFAVYTYPFILGIGTTSLGIEDSNIYYFNAFNFKYQVDHLSNPFFTEHMFFPDGMSMVMHTNTSTMSAFSYFFSNTILGMNIFLILNYIVSGIGGYFIGKKFLKRDFISFVVGFIFAFSSYKTMRLSAHLNLVLTAATPFILLGYFRILEKRKKTDMLMVLVLIVFSALSDYVVTFIVLMFVSTHFVGLKLTPLIKKYYLKNKWYFGVFSLSLVIICDQVIQVIKRAGVDDRGAIWYSGDVSSFFTPIFSRMYEGHGFMSIFKEGIGKAYGLETTLFVGFILLLLFVYSLFIKREENSFKDKWTNISTLIFPTVFFFFSLIPQFKLFGFRLFYSPTALIHFIPFLNNNRNPTRGFYIFILFFSILIFWKLLNSKKSEWFKSNIITSVLFILLFMEFWPSKIPSTNREKVPEVYSALSKQPLENALILPFGYVDSFVNLGEFDRNQLGNIPVHQKKLFGGFISRMNPVILENQGKNLFLKKLINADEVKTEELVGLTDLVKSFKELNVNYVVIPSERVDSNQHLVLNKILIEINHVAKVFDSGILIIIE